MGNLLQLNNAEIVILILTAMILGTLLILVPQLLRAHKYHQELLHQEHMRALDQGHPLPPVDYLSLAAGRTAALVPMVVVCAAGTVTCFLAAYKLESLFAVALAVWSVAGVVSLAAITGGVALMGRLAQLKVGATDYEPPENPLDKFAS
ncbi:MAG: hypothetical protein ACK4RK_08460 [Gemmataceae bacterium]